MDTDYGQRLAQRLRERARLRMTMRTQPGRTAAKGYFAQEQEARKLWRQADLAEREWPLPNFTNQRVNGLRTLSVDRVEWRQHNRRVQLCSESGDWWINIQDESGIRGFDNPTPADLHRALLWLVGLAESPI